MQGENISKDLYNQALEDYTKGFTSFGDYMIYYCRQDVNIMLQASLNQRSIWRNQFNLDTTGLEFYDSCTLPAAVFIFRKYIN